MRRQVGIVGGGPAGLVLSHLLHLEGIESVVLELRSRHAVETTVRAGVLEHGTAELLRETGVGERMDREGAVHNGVNLQFGGHRHRIDFPELTGGRKISIYGQQEVVKDLYAARLETGGQIIFEAAATGLRDLDATAPKIRFRRGAELVGGGGDPLPRECGGRGDHLRLRGRVRRLLRCVQAVRTRGCPQGARPYLPVRMVRHPR